MQATDTYPLADSEDGPRTELAEGGFSGDTQIMTTVGPVTISKLTPEDTVLALNPTTRVVKPKDVVQVQTVLDIDEVVAIETSRSDFCLAPDHRFCYTTRASSNPRFTLAGDLQQWFQRRFVNEWRPRSGTRLEEVDISEFVDEYEICAASDDYGHTFRAALPDGCQPQRRISHNGYYFDPETFKQYQSEIESIADETSLHAGSNARFRPYRFEGDDFIEFLGWFITEGSVSWRQTKDSATVKLAQKDSETRSKITSLFERLGIEVSTTNEGFCFGSTVYGELLEELCGTDSYNKQIPSFIWNVSSDQKRLLLDTLMQGDGNEFKTYYTASDDLAADVLRLMVEQGLKPRYTQRENCWQIYLSTVNDGFKPPANVHWKDNDESLYRLAIQDFSLVMAGRNGKFQWIGVSRVA